MFVQPSKTVPCIVVTLAGIVIDVRPVQPLNASWWICSKLAGNVTDVIPVIPWHKQLGIMRTCSPKLIAVIVVFAFPKGV